MKTSASLPSLARCAVSVAINRLRVRGFAGEAARARVTRDTTERQVRELLESNLDRIACASALRIVRSAAAFAYRVELMAEVSSQRKLCSS